jgi:hypothetical protein
LSAKLFSAPDHLEELFPVVEELGESDETAYEELVKPSLVTVTADAALLLIAGKKMWIPLSQLRQLDGALYASNWIMRKKREE